MYQTISAKLLLLISHLKKHSREFSRQELLYTVLALWCQYLSFAALAVYGILRVLLATDVPLGQYSGPLELLWPVSYVLLLVSSAADRILWQEEMEDVQEKESVGEKEEIDPSE